MRSFLKMLARLAALIPGLVGLKRMVCARILRISLFPIYKPSRRGPPPVADRAKLLHEYSSSEVGAQPDDFVLYRIVGNDLYPRHAKGQSRQNLSFILEHEPRLENCE